MDVAGAESPSTTTYRHAKDSHEEYQLAKAALTHASKPFEGWIKSNVNSDREDFTEDVS